MASTQSRIVTHDFGRGASWQGRSGRTYGLVGENLEHFVMIESALYVIAKGKSVLWVGSTNELVEDPMSRTRFRLALDCADRAFRVLSDNAVTERLSTIWDLEGAEPLAGAQAA